MEANRLRISSGTEVVDRRREEPAVVVTRDLHKMFDLTARQAQVFDWMYSNVGRCESGGRAFRAIDIASATGCDTKTVTEAWKELRSLKLLTLVTKGSRRGPTVYAVHDPERVYADRIVAAPACGQRVLSFDADEEAADLPGELPGKIPGNLDEVTSRVAQAAGGDHLPGDLPGNSPGKARFMTHEMNLLKNSSHDGAAARCAPPPEPRPARAPNRTAETSEESEESLLAQFHRKQRERMAIHAPLSTVGSLLALHDRRAAHGRDSPPCSAAADFEPVAGDGTGAIGELALKLQVRTADPAAEWRLFVDLARDVVEKRLPWDVIKQWFDRMDRAGDKVESRGAVLRSNYKRYGRR